MSSRIQVPGEPVNGEKSSSTLTERHYTRDKKLKISAQKFPCFLVVKREFQVLLLERK